MVVTNVVLLLLPEGNAAARFTPLALADPVMFDAGGDDDNGGSGQKGQNANKGELSQVKAKAKRRKKSTKNATSAHGETENKLARCRRAHSVRAENNAPLQD